MGHDVVMPGVDVLLLTVGHGGCDASILTMMRRRYYSGDMHRQRELPSQFPSQVLGLHGPVLWSWKYRFFGVQNSTEINRSLNLQDVRHGEVGLRRRCRIDSKVQNRTAQNAFTPRRPDEGQYTNRCFALPVCRLLHAADNSDPIFLL